MENLKNELKSKKIDYDLIEKENEKFVVLHSDKLDDINSVIDAIKKTENDGTRVLVDLASDCNTYGKEFLKSITDKDMVTFHPKNDSIRFSVEDLNKLEDLMDIMVKDIKESELSPYERYIAVYDLVRSFKEYQFYENSESKDEKNPEHSRNVYMVLMNEWIVCVGYSRLLNALLGRVGINSMDWTAGNNLHARNFVHLKDEKYNIDGFYMCDATFDSTVDDIILKPGVHMNMTRSQAYYLNPELSINDKVLTDDPFEMVGFLRDEKKKAKLEKIISNLDPKFFSNIKEEFDSFGQNPVYDPNFYFGSLATNEYAFARRICEYIMNKSNKAIDLKTEAQASVRVQEFVNGEKYSEEEFDKKCKECEFYLDDAREEYLEEHRVRRAI